MEHRRWADGAFETFWRAYPRKTGKLAAKREWDRLRPDTALVGQIMAALAWQVETWDDPQYTPHPRTWLHQGRWLDEPTEAKRGKSMSDAAATVFRVIGGQKA